MHECYVYYTAYSHVTFDFVTKHIKTSPWCTPDWWFAVCCWYKSCLSYSCCLEHILIDVKLQSFTHRCVCEEMGLSKGPWFLSGSWKCEKAACLLWQWLPMSFSFRMSSGFPSPLNEEQTTIVCQACCFYSSSQWIFFLGAANVDDGSASGSLRLGRTCVGLVRMIFMSPNFQTGPPCH